METNSDVRRTTNEGGGVTQIKIPRMRTIAEIASECSLPFNFVRRSVLDGRVPHVKAGRKYLVNMELFISFLYNESNPTDSEPTGQSGVRRVG